MADPSVSFYQVQQQFRHEMRWKEREIERERQREAEEQRNGQKGAGATSGAEDEAGMEGYLQYKRWEYYMEPRVYPSGDLSLPSSNWARFQEYLDGNSDANYQYQRSQPGGSSQRLSGPNFIMSSSWTFAGPTGAPTGSGAGRVNFLRFDPTNTNTIYVGAPAGGLWKSTNGGTSWTTNTDFLSVIGVTDIAIDPTNTQTMYIATGDGDAGDTYSIGVLKSTDGGATWNTTGLSWTVNQGRVISKLLINSTNPQIIMAFSSAGIWRTTNGGTSWTQVSTASVKDAEYQPGSVNTVYAGGTRFYKSTDGGATWTNITSGLPANTAIDRMAIAVSANNSAYVYVLCGNATNDGFYGLYRSTDNGTTFATRSTTPNVLGWASAGNDTGGQGWYDLSIDADPTNANNIVVGGVNVWRSTNGGTSWTLNAHWTGSGAPYIHADVHSLNYMPGSGTTYFATSDGGVFKTSNNGGAWSDLSNNLCIAQPYRIGLSASNANLWITGHQDNGTNIKNGATYAGTMGGDGMDCFIDRTNNNVMYGEQYSGSLNRTTNGGGSWSAITTGLSGTAPWVTPWYQDPTTANTIYCGRTNLFKSTNQGTNWSQLTALPTTPSGTIVDFKVAPSNNQVIYVARAQGLFKTTNGGTSWTTVTGTLPTASAYISRVDVKPNDPNTVYVTFSGYSSGNKVFKTTNGGTSWTNISAGLPNLPVNCVRFDASNTGTEAVYVGCDVGVYYMDNTFSSWQPYFTSLPNVPVFDLEVYTPTGKLRAATYGRGVWEVDIYNPGTLPPVAQFAASTLITCTGAPVNFTDQSSFAPTNWTWTFPSATPGSSSSQNPAGVVWNTAGTYTVTLTCSNANGSSSTTQVVTVLGAVTPPLVEGFESTTFLPTNWSANNINNDAMFWTQASTGATSTKSAMFDNYNNDVAGAQDEMWAPRFDCSSFSTLSMTFDVAYAPYDLVTYTDTLQVLVSTDCGVTWNSVYLKGGATLGTSGAQTTAFTPTAAQWRNEAVNLNTYAGQSSVLVIFRNRGHYGNILYVDNINITGSASAIPSGTFTASTTTVCAGTPINFTDASSGSPTSWTWTFPSGTPASSTAQNVTGVVWNTAGTYTVTHTATNGNGTGTTTQVITVNAVPAVTSSASSSTICTGNSTTLTASGASTYTWMPGSLSGASVTVSPTTTTTYTVTGTNASGCTNTATQLITVNPTPTVTTTATGTTICSGSSTTITASGATTYNWMPGSLTGSSVTVSPTTTTTYTVTGTSSGCSGTATRIITVNPSPTVTTTTSGGTICSGNSTTITAAGGTSYSWMPGSLTGTTVTVSPTTTTTYTVTGTAANGCTNTATRTITVNPTPTVTTTTSGGTICSGSSTTITAAGATTYSWMPGSLTGSTVTVSPTTTTTYTVTGTSSGCSGTATRIITVNPSPTVTTTTSGGTICSGNSTTITASGGTSYSWMPGSLTGTTVTVSPTTTTTYTVTGTSANGCTNTATRTITVNPTPTVTTTTSGGTICSGSSTTITAAGATTYSWMPGSLTGTTVTVSPTTTTTYTVTGTSTGCTGTATRTITVNPTPTVTTTTSGGTICSGNSTTMTASGGTSYTWMPGSLTGTTVTVSPSTTTTYTVTGTGANGCTNTATRTITVNPSPTVTVSASSTSICTGNSVTLTSSGASAYAWNPGSLSGSSITVTPGSTTTYTVTGTAANGCTNTQTQTITVGAAPTVTAVSSGSICTGGSATLTGNGATTYSWMPGSLTGTSVTVSPSTTTTYTVTGTVGAGCSNTATVTVAVNANPTVTSTTSNSTICSGNTTTLSASGATSYNWQPGSLSGSSVTVSPATSTTYTVTGTSAAGCTNTSTVAITVNASPTVTATSSSAGICAGNTVTLTGSGANTYNWMPGSLSGASVTDTPASSTTYTLTGTNANGCTGTETVSVTVNALPVVTSSASSSSICSGNSITLTGNGATSYVWMPGNLSGATVTDTPASSTTYSVTGTDANGCSASSTVAVTVNAPPSVSATSSASTICSGSSVTLTGSGASTYDWIPGNLSGASVTDMPVTNTTYTVTGTDANGCSNTALVAVTVNASPIVSAASSSTSLCSGGTITLTGNGASTYNWMPGNLSGATVTDTPSATTTYTLTGTDANGCSDTALTTVTVNPQPTISVSGTNSICEGNSVTLNAAGGATYVWQPGGQNTSSITDNPATTTTYTVTGTDTNGCTNTSTYQVTVFPLPSVPTILVNGSVLTSSVTGASYQWYLNGNPIAGATSQSYTATQTGSYTVEVFDANGCSSGQSSAVIDPTGIAGAVSGVDFITVTPNPNDGHFTLNFQVNKTDDYVLEIFNALGQIVYSEALPNFNGVYSGQVDLSVYDRGLYTIRLRSTHTETILKTVTY